MMRHWDALLVDYLMLQYELSYVYICLLHMYDTVPLKIEYPL